jgi:CO dehydrogenase nickel-insertion accessory protein CooC1
METSNLAEQKLLLFQKIMNIQNEKKLKQIVFIINKVTQSSKDKVDISFEEWNSLFMEDNDLNEFISDYNMTLGDYRKKIYEAEISQSLPLEDFLTKLEKYV